MLTNAPEKKAAMPKPSGPMGVQALRTQYLQYTEQSQDDPRLSWKDWLDGQGYDLTGLDRAALMVPVKFTLPGKVGPQ